LWYAAGMTKEEITSVLDRVRSWPKERQEDLARIALQIEARDIGIVPEDDATRAAIAEGLAQARRGEFVTDEDMAAFFRSHGL
jgi:predicted transcriptional regulator